MNHQLTGTILLDINAQYRSFDAQRCIVCNQNGLGILFFLQQPFANTKDSIARRCLIPRFGQYAGLMI